jgi:MurNAc alpha-1-phosphate uridylyltransferase
VRQLDTGGGLKQALPHIDTDPVLVMNPDAFWLPGADRPLERLGARFATGDADIVLLCAQPYRMLGFRRGHDFCRDPLGRLTPDAGQPVIYAGVALLRRELVTAVAAETFSLYALFVAALERRRLWGEVLDAPWLHVGDPQALAEADAWLGAKHP